MDGPRSVLALLPRSLHRNESVWNLRDFRRAARQPACLFVTQNRRQMGVSFAMQLCASVSFKPRLFVPGLRDSDQQTPDFDKEKATGIGEIELGRDFPQATQRLVCFINPT